MVNSTDRVLQLPQCTQQGSCHFCTPITQMPILAIFFIFAKSTIAHTKCSQRQDGGGDLGKGKKAKNFSTKEDRILCRSNLYICRTQLTEMGNAILHFGSALQNISTKPSLLEALCTLQDCWRQNWDTLSVTLENSVVCTNRFIIARNLAPNLMMFWSGCWSITKTGT